MANTDFIYQDILNNPKLSKEQKVYLPKNEDTPELEDVITCKHNFMPIDSTGEILACSKCGYIVTKKRLNKNRNIFKDY